MRPRAYLPPLLMLLLGACEPSLRRFALAPPLWRDPDDQPVARRPAERFAGLYSDGINATLLEPLSDAFAFRRSGEARNVNALDEVPSSSWFENRIGLRAMSIEEVARGACTDPPLEAQQGRWTVISGKLEGVTSGFVIKAGDERYLLKVDGSFRPERASAADVVGALLYHSAGYHAPCNQVVYFPRERLVIAPRARYSDQLGRKRPMGEAELQRALEQAVRFEDGRLRAVASRYLPGQPLGPFAYQGVRPDDPNDIIPHEDRRELRASRLLAAWISRFDIREQNSLDMWIDEKGRRFVRHYQLDFGDALGSPWQGTDPLDRRVGHAYFFDVQQITEDLFTLGLLPRPWYRARIADDAEIFGYFGSRDFVPSRWRPIQPNPAFERMTWRDALWMVRIIVRFSDEQLRAMVAKARLSNPRAERYLLRTLVERRNRIAAEYLRHYVPLADPTLGTPGPDGAQHLCFSDLGIAHAGVRAEQVHYKVHLLGGRLLHRRLGWRQLQPDPRTPSRSCLRLPLSAVRPSDLAPASSPDHHPLRYAVLEIATQQRPSLRPTRFRLHLYDRGPRGGFVLAGVERAAPSER